MLFYSSRTNKKKPAIIYEGFKKKIIKIICRQTFLEKLTYKIIGKKKTHTHTHLIKQTKEKVFNKIIEEKKKSAGKSFNIKRF